MKLSESVKAWRTAHGLGQKQMADLIGISTKHYARIEGGHDYPSYPILERICEITHLVEDFHFEGDNSKRSKK